MNFRKVSHYTPEGLNMHNPSGVLNAFVLYSTSIMLYKITTFFKITHHLRNYYDLLGITLHLAMYSPLKSFHKDNFTIFAL